MPSKYIRIVPVFGLLTAFTLMVGSASAQVADQPRPQPGAPGGAGAAGSASATAVAEPVCRAGKARGADRSR